MIEIGSNLMTTLLGLAFIGAMIIYFVLVTRD